MARDRIATVDQRSLNLFLLYGTVPMTLHQQQYFIPVQLWLPLAYPAASPLCYVAPTAGMAVRSGQYVKPNGRLMPTYVTQWTPAVRVGSGSTWHGGGADTHRRHDSARGPQTSNLGDLVADHGGSYVLTLVAYNAGPRRARVWLAEYGDFRAGQVDPIDWIESIPFQETRQYVQKVMQNLHVYRSRLAPKTVRPMTADLMRGARTDSLNVASTSPAPEAAAEPASDPAKGCSKASLASLITGCD